MITIRCNGDIGNDASVSIFNATGQKLHAGQIKNTCTVIDRGLTAGLYIVSLTNGGKSITSKVMLN